MAADAFDEVLQSQFEELRGRLLGEHRLALQQLEDKVSALEEENRLLQLQATPPAEEPSTSERCQTPGKQQGPTLLQQRVEQGVGKCEPRSGLEGNGGLQGTLPCSVPQGPGASEPGGLAATGWRFSDCEASEAPAAAEEAITAREFGSIIASFKVLDIWERQRVRASSRKVSVHSLDRLSSGSGTTYFGSNYTNDDDDEQDISAQRWLESKVQLLMLPPSSLRHLCWELAGLLLVAHDIAVIPLQILQPPENAFTTLMSWLIRFFWTFDILVSFLTGYVSPQGLVELRPARVARQYARTRLGFDLLLVGCDWAEALVAVLPGGRNGQDASVLRLLGMLRAIRLVRLIRLAKSQKISEFIFEHIRSEGIMLVAYIVAIMVLLLGLIHVIACVWHGIRGPEKQAQESADLSAQYFAAFHFVLSLFAGEQLLMPETVLERIFTILVLIFAFVVSAAFVGSLTTAMTRLQVVASKRSTQFATLNRYLSDYGISRELAARVQRNARHALKEQKRHTPESSVELMALISDPLRSEIRYEVFSPMIILHPFFHLYNWVNPVGVRHICHTAVKSVSLSRGDVIFSEFEVPVSPRMFFVTSGRMVYVRCTESQQRVQARQWVAEAVLWTRWAHRGTLRALTECRLLSMDAQHVASIMSTFPTCHGLNYAMKFVAGLNKASACGSLTDIQDSEEHGRQMASSVFQDLDRNLEVPYEWRSRRHSGLSMGSLVSTRRISYGSSRRSSVLTVTPSIAS